jgi:hypothetical protein
MLQKAGHDLTLAIPLHHQLGPGILRGLLRDAGMSPEELLGLL